LLLRNGAVGHRALPSAICNSTKMELSRQRQNQRF
jgi:hypothetical protein